MVNKLLKVGFTSIVRQNGSTFITKCTPKIRNDIGEYYNEPKCKCARGTCTIEIGEDIYDFKLKPRIVYPLACVLPDDEIIDIQNIVKKYCMLGYNRLIRMGFSKYFLLNNNDEKIKAPKKLRIFVEKWYIPLDLNELPFVQEDEYNKRYYVVREKSGDLFICKGEIPEKQEDGTYDAYISLLSENKINMLPTDLFPEVTFESGPKQIATMNIEG